MARTLAHSTSRSGIGLHSGLSTCVTLRPEMRLNAGRYFVRTDCPDAQPIPACVTSVGETTLSTELTNATTSVRTVEHLLAALVATGIDAVCIEIDGTEVPLLDGSSQGWIEAIAEAGSTAIEEVKTTDRGNENANGAIAPSLEEPLWVRDGDSFVVALPSEQLRFSYGIEFDVTPIGQQWYSWSSSSETDPFDGFIHDIAPARTFGLAHQVEQLRAMGLIRGGSLDNALVCDRDRWLNPPLRFPNEPVRHKILDLVGDLSLIGMIPKAHYLAYKASHRLHIALASQLSRQGTSTLAVLHDRI